MYSIEASGLVKVYEKGVRAVDSVDLSVEEGEVFGLLGPNGAGKSTTIKMLLTLLKPTSGSIKILGLDALREPSKVRQLVGYVPQEVSVDGDLTGYENLLVFSKLYHNMDSATRRERIREALEYMGLTERAGELVKNYSGGMMRRLEIAQALVNRPKILFLDEPSIGLDPSVRREVWGLIRKLNRELGMTIFMTTHDMIEADELCGRLAIMNMGKIVVMGRPDELKRSVGADIISIKLVRGDGEAGLADSVTIPSELGRIVSLSGDEVVITPSIRVEEAVPRLLNELSNRGLQVASISLSRPTLDDVFLKFTKTRIDQAETLRQARLARRSFRRHAR